MYIYIYKYTCTYIHNIVHNMITISMMSDRMVITIIHIYCPGIHHHGYACE
jgi:hypothetical protein